MLSEELNVENSVIEQEKDLNDQIDNALVDIPVSLEKNEAKIVNDLIEAESKDVLQSQFDLFNMNQCKKNALRVIKLNNLLNKVEDQVIDRFEKRPDQISNKELIEYMNVVANQIDRAQRFNIDVINEEKPSIKIINKKEEVNINVAPQLNRDSKEKVMNAISALLKQASKKEIVYDVTPQDVEDECVDTKQDNIIDSNVLKDEE